MRVDTEAYKKGECMVATVIMRKTRPPVTAWPPKVIFIVVPLLKSPKP